MLIVDVTVRDTVEGTDLVVSDPLLMLLPVTLVYWLIVLGE